MTDDDRDYSTRYPRTAQAVAALHELALAEVQEVAAREGRTFTEFNGPPQEASDAISFCIAEYVQSQRDEDGDLVDELEEE